MTHVSQSRGRIDTSLNWGPFSDKKTGQRRNTSDRDKDRWMEDWHPIKWNEQFAHPKRKFCNPWLLDSYSLSAVLEHFVACYISKLIEHDEEEKEAVGTFCSKISNLLRNDQLKEPREVCDNLGHVSSLLRNFTLDHGDPNKG